MDKPKVIVVDDQPENLQILVEILKHQYAVIATISGEKALDLAKQTPKASAILLDVYMPNMDGFEVCSQLKAHPDTADIPVIFITGTSTEEDYKKGFAVGGYDFIQKPVSATLLEQRLLRFL